MQVTMTVAGMETFRLINAPPMVYDQLRGWEERSGQRGEMQAKIEAPRDRSILAGSITHAMGRVFVEGAANSYAPYVHGYIATTSVGDRSTPHWPPFGPGSDLAEWAWRHGIPPFLVARAISRNGTPLVPFLTMALDAQRENILVDARQTLRAIVSRLRGKG